MNEWLKVATGHEWYVAVTTGHAGYWRYCCHRFANSISPLLGCSHWFVSRVVELVLAAECQLLVTRAKSEWLARMSLSIGLVAWYGH